jgi:hypothetical protein
MKRRLSFWPVVVGLSVNFCLEIQSEWNWKENRISISISMNLNLLIIVMDIY